MREEKARKPITPEEALKICVGVEPVLTPLPTL